LVDDGEPLHHVVILMLDDVAVMDVALIGGGRTGWPGALPALSGDLREIASRWSELAPACAMPYAPEEAGFKRWVCMGWVSPVEPGLMPLI
jgi:hypothetical protein